MAKKLYPGGFRLTLKTARALAVQEFGTASGLKQSDWANSEGFYVMTLGNLEIEIHQDMSGSGCIQIDISMHGAPGHIYQLHDRDTLHRNYKEEDVQRRKERREEFESWVSAGGPEPCHKAIDDFWNGRRGWKMEVNVSMTAEDFMAFMEWKRDKKVYERRVQEVIKNMEHLANSVLKTLVECGKTDEPEYKIESQDAAKALAEEATEIF